MVVVARVIGRVSRGVTAFMFKSDGDYVCGAATIENEEDELLMLSEKGLGKRTTASEYREQNRAGKGVISMKLTPKTGDVVGVVMVEEDKDLMCLTSVGKMIRVDMEQIRKAGRNTSGVKVVTVEKKDIVVSMAKCQKEEKPDESKEGEDCEGEITQDAPQTSTENNNDNTTGLF
jgi:DNA gyrase subunit A